MKTSVLCSSLVALMSSTDVHGFAPSRVNSAASATRVAASSSDNEGDSRRQFLSQTLATGFTYSAAALASTGVLAPLPANAASAQDKVNARLKS